MRLKSNIQVYKIYNSFAYNDKSIRLVQIVYTTNKTYANQKKFYKQFKLF